MGAAGSIDSNPQQAGEQVTAANSHTPAAAVSKEETRKHSPKAAVTDDTHHAAKKEHKHSPKDAAKKSRKDFDKNNEERPKKEKKPSRKTAEKKGDEPIAIPVNGRTVYIVGHQGSNLVLRYVPKGETQSVLIRCPAAYAQIFIEHIDDYAYHDLEGATVPEEANTTTPLPPLSVAPSLPSAPQAADRELELPPPNYSPAHQELMTSMPRAAAADVEDEALALAIARSLTIKEDLRNYDLSPPASHTSLAGRQLPLSHSSTRECTHSDMMSAFDIRDDISHQLRERPHPLSAHKKAPATKVSVPASHAELPPPSYSIALRQSAHVETEAALAPPAYISAV